MSAYFSLKSPSHVKIILFLSLIIHFHCTQAKSSIEAQTILTALMINFDQLLMIAVQLCMEAQLADPLLCWFVESYPLQIEPLTKQSLVVKL